MLERLRRLMRRISHLNDPPVDRYAPMLIDAPDAPARIAALPEQVRGPLSELSEKGLARLPGNVPHELCDQVLADFTSYCAEHPEHESFKDEHGLHDRLACLHMSSPRAMAIGLNTRVLEIVDAAFGKPGVIVGSLLFERGSEQDVHRDTPAFFTVPLNHFFGVWTALEDIRPESGRLVYYAGGHRVVSDREFVGSGVQNMDRYFARIEEACRERGCPLLEVTAQKGDTFIWHPQLPHGGGPIKDRKCSRKSIVFHYTPEGVPCYGADAFFGLEPVDPWQNVAYLARGDRHYFDQGQPRFFRNRKEGNFNEQRMMR